MKITNKHGLSRVWELAVLDDYDQAQSGWRSGTGLIKPPQMAELQRRYSDRMTEDVSDRIWSLFGSACHYVLAKCASQIEGAISEKRFLIERFGKMIGFKPDLIWPKPDGTYHLNDFKFPSVWAVIFKEYDEWFEQVNLYAHCLRQKKIFTHDDNGTLIQAPPINVTSASIEVAMRDWSLTDSLKDPEYPRDKTEIIPVDLWPEHKAEDFLCERVQMHITAEKSPDEKMLPCTDKERWARPDKFAVKKKGAARASRVFDTQTEAQEMVDDKGHEYEIEYRRGENIRCERYCSAKCVCAQYDLIIHPEF